MKLLRILYLFVCTLFMLPITVAAQAPVLLPALITKHEVNGAIFDRADKIRTEHEDGHVTLDVTSLMSSDEKFASGMYRSGKTRYDITEGYGVDEFMYFIEGSITLTSKDGTKQVVAAGEAVTVPKEWKGVFETDGYTKFWVIYSADGSGL